MNLFRFHIFLLPFILFFSTGKYVSAQTVTISPEVITEQGFGYTKVIGQNENGYFLLLSNLSLNTKSDRIGFRTRKYRIAWYDRHLNKKWSKPVDPESDQVSIDAVTFFNGNFLVVTSRYLKTEKKVRYTIATVDENGNFPVDNKMVAEFSQVNNDYEKSNVIFSANRNLFAVVMREFTNDTSQTVYAAVLDTGFRVMTQKSVTVPFSEKKFEFEGFALSDQGALAILGFHSEKIKALSSKRRIEYYLYACHSGEPHFREYKLPTDKSISALGTAFDNFNNQVVLAGFYFEKDTYTGAGIYYATLDINQNNELKINTKAIDGQSNIRLKGERSLSSGVGIIGYPIERIVIRNDGGALLVAEASYVTEYSYYDYFSQSFTQRLEYHFENVVIISVNRDGSVDWSTILEKDQVSIDDGGVFSSFCSMLNSEQLLILYNDDISRRNQIIPYSVDIKGKATPMKPLPKSEGFIILPKSAKQVSENELLAPAYRKRDLYLVRFSF